MLDLPEIYQHTLLDQQYRSQNLTPDIHLNKLTGIKMHLLLPMVAAGQVRPEALRVFD